MNRRSALRSLLLPEEGWLSFGFVLAIALSSVWSLDAAGWVENLDILPWITLAAVCAGYLFAQLRLPRLLAHLAGMLVGVGTIIYAVAGTMPGRALEPKATLLWERFERWFATTSTGGVSTDNLLFLLLLAALSWLMGYYGAWSVFRARGPWWIILASGSILVVNLSYSRSLDLYALLYLFAAILLVVRLNITVQQGLWQSNGIEYSREFSSQLLRNSVVIAIVVVGATWFAPSTTANEMLTEAWGQVSGPWQQAESQFSRLFGGIRVKGDTTTSGFGKTLPLRGASALGDAPVLAVIDSQPRYLRGVVYERYTGQGWTAPERSAEQLAANDERMAITGTLRMREEITATIKVLQDRGMTVLAPAQPLRVSVPVGAEFELSPGPPARSAYSDVSVMRSAAMLRRGQQYTAVASISHADELSLSRAGRFYPDWVRQRYLSLPRTIPGRVIAQARRIAGGIGNPYDQAVAIQNFLRGYPYSDNVPPAPPDRDTVDFFLFDARVGYCDYYASAMVVMLRVLGIPARIVSGYAPGEYDPSQQAYIVRDSHAHSWPEVYFPEYGWIEFEPTASRPVLSRDEEQGENPPADAPPDVPLSALESTEADFEPLDELGGTPDATSDVAAGRRFGEVAGKALPTLAVLLSIGLLIWLIWKRRFRGLTVAEAAYDKMATVSAWVGLGRRVHETPYEHSRQVALRMPAQRDDISLIVDHFVRRRFGRKAPKAGEDAAIQQAWRRLRGRLIGLAWGRVSRRNGR